MASLVRETTHKVLIGVIDDKNEQMSRLNDEKLKKINTLERCVDEMCQFGL